MLNRPHRDVKPENLLLHAVGEDAKLKIMDFRSSVLYKPDSWVLPYRTENLEEVYTLGHTGPGRFGTTLICTHLRVHVNPQGALRLRLEEDSDNAAPERYGQREAANLIKNVVVIPLFFVAKLKIIDFDSSVFYKPVTIIGLQNIHFKLLLALCFITARSTPLKFEISPSFISVITRSTRNSFMLRTLNTVLCFSGEILCDVVGSPYYVAQEVLRKHYGPESDMWSAGVILYILLSGVPPFWAETEQEILLGRLDFHEPWPSISDSAKDLIQKMLDQNPKKA
ncbi:hypothetical protein CR513_41059, partial [Mucuna pruriens]